ncbi:unnamed protein product [Larinioides sclopetarius]|uniref:Uncharacterized protein n=1 Tax=Larinioides sclopetarius TaxID=280406 RepID=A0AAV2A802_9ARAC
MESSINIQILHFHLVLVDEIPSLYTRSLSVRQFYFR